MTFKYYKGSLKTINWVTPVTPLYIGVIESGSADPSDSVRVVELYPVNKNTYLKTVDYVMKANVIWNNGGARTAFYRYSIFVLENPAESDIYNITTIPAITTPSSTYTDANGNVITTPGMTIPSTTTKSPKSYDVLSGLPAYAEDLIVPSYYDGNASVGAPLFA